MCPKKLIPPLYLYQFHAQNPSPMKLHLMVLAVLFFCVTATAQKVPFKFGKVSTAELKMSRYDKDSSAVAVVLGDYGVSRITFNQNKADWVLNFERVLRIKILKKEGFSFADFEIRLYKNSSNREKLNRLNVITHNFENGKDEETIMGSDATHEEEYSENLILKKFTAPKVKEGSVIEVTYEIASDFTYYFREWGFQSTIPVVWSEYRAIIPEYFNYQQFMQGYIDLSIIESHVYPNTISSLSMIHSGWYVPGSTMIANQIKFNEKTYRWVAQDVPSFKEEPFMTTPSDYISKLKFELASITRSNMTVNNIMGTWESLNQSLLEDEDFGKAINVSVFTKKLTEEATAGVSTPHEKVAAIYNFVKSNIEWNNRYGKFLYSGFKKAIEDKKGSSADINLLLVAMLQRAGFEANPVIISTRDHGFVRKNVAVSSQFNYVICQLLIDGKSTLLDATDRLLPMNLLPERCLNGYGYIISKVNPGWVALNAPKSKTYVVAEAALTPAGQMKGKADIRHDGYFAYAVRDAYSKKGEEEYVKDFSSSHEWELNKSSFENLTSISDAVTEKYEFTHDKSTANGDIIYFNPLLHLKIDENPFRLQERLYPVDFGKATERTFVGKFTVPDGFVVDELPKPAVVILPENGGRFSYNVQITGNTINIISVLAINQSLFTQDEYKGLRDFFDLIVAKHAEQIVLKKQP